MSSSALDASGRRAIRQHVQSLIDPDSVLARRPRGEAAIRVELAALVESTARSRGVLLPGATLAQLQRSVIDDVLGYGPLQPLLDDPSIQEIMVNAPDIVFVERDGQLERSDVEFDDVPHVLAVLERFLRRVGRRVDESSPAIDARLPELGFRLHAIIPPLSLNGPSITIRKFPKTFSVAELVANGSMTTGAAGFLMAAVRARANIIVSGGTGSGKTTLLNALAEAIDDRERIVTIEDTAELRLDKPNAVSLQARPTNVEGRGAYTIRDLVVNALRMRPDRVIVGEVRRDEALDMLQAMNTGHDGSLTTVHANDPADVVSRLETMILQAGVSYPLRAIRQQIRSALHLLVHVSRNADGSRGVESIAEFGELNEHDDLPVITLARADDHGRLSFIARPRFTERLARQRRDAFEEVSRRLPG